MYREHRKKSGAEKEIPRVPIMTQLPVMGILLLPLIMVQRSVHVRIITRKGITEGGYRTAVTQGVHVFGAY